MAHNPGQGITRHDKEGDSMRAGLEVVAARRAATDKAYTPTYADGAPDEDVLREALRSLAYVRRGTGDVR